MKPLLSSSPSPDPRMTRTADGAPSDYATKIQEFLERIMRLYIDGPVNKYYIQTLCMIFFPGSKFSDDEPVTEEEVALAKRLATEAVTEYGVRID